MLPPTSNVLRLTRRLAHWCAALLLGASALASLPAAAADNAKKFDHLTTGFPLTGQHENARCEDCHVRGIFRGTQRQCAACHTAGSLVTAVQIPGKHIQTPDPCDTCHTTNTFYGARFEHSAVAQGTCFACHNGINAKGKTAGHVITTASCDSCHTTVSFGLAYVAVPVGHIPTQQACSTCHKDNTNFAQVTMDHTGTAGQCQLCHAASVVPRTFTIPGSVTINGAQILVNSTGQPIVVTPEAWTTSTGVLWQAAGAPVTHMPTGAASCDQCHSNGTFTLGSGFKGAAMKHSAVTSLTCSTCHNTATFFVGTGVGPGGQPFQIPGGTGAVPGAANHIPVGAVDCASSGCHVASDTATTTGAGFATGATPALSAAGHASVSSVSCETCHSAGYTWKLSASSMVTPLSNHIAPDNIAPASVGCISCHSGSSFGTGGFKLGGTPVMTAAMHAVPAIAAMACTTCHESLAANLGFQGVNALIYLRPNAGANSGLSNGVDALHVDSASGGLRGSGDCQSCHSTSPPFTTVAKPKNHIPILASAACADCHANLGYGPGYSTMKHSDVQQTPCATCHNSNNGGLGWAGTAQGSQGQPWQIPAVSASGGHIPVNGVDCGNSGCHTASDTMTSTGASFQITTVPALNATAHTAVNLACEKCHTVGMAWKLAGGATMVTPTSLHIPPDNTASGAIACSSCHSATSFSAGGFKLAGTPGTSPVMSVAMHTTVASAVPQCLTCHEANAANLTFQGVSGNIYLRPDTATSGLSKGTGLDAAHGTGNAATEDCSVCHTTAPPFTSTTLPTNHVKLLSTAACADCHSGGYSPGISKMKHADVTQTPCSACHNSTNGSLGWAGTGQGTNGQPYQIPGGTGAAAGAANHIPVGSVDCGNSGCHTVSDTMTANGASFATGVTPALSAAGHSAVSAVACATCHSQGYTWLLAAGASSMVTPTTAHVPPDNAAPASVACTSCHSSTSFGTAGFKLTGTVGTAAPVMTVAMHSAVSSLTCATCHEQAGLTAGDLLFQGVAGNIILRPGYGANSGFNYTAAGQTVSSQNDTAHATGNASTQDCAACHSTTPPFTAQAKPSNHIPVLASAACSDCHAVGYGSGKSTMKHADVTQTPCAACHNSTNGTLGWAGTGQGTNGQPYQIPGGTGAASGASNHIPVGSVDCGNSGCHTVSDTMTANGASFATGVTPALSAAGHSAVSAVACATCHARGYTWLLAAGASSMVTPATNHVPPDNTAPASVACTSCHSSTSFGSAGFKLTGTVGTASPVMTVAMHSAVSSLTCATCHEQAGLTAGDLLFQGITTNIILRPGYGANSGYNFTASGATVATQSDTNHATGSEATGDCGGCHNTTPPFANGTAIPTGHIAIVSGTTCATCHTTAGVYYNVVLPMPHTAVSGTCASCHNSATKFAGSVFTPSGTSGGTFGTQTSGLNFQARQIISSPAVGAVGGHIPLPSADDCNVCHLSTSAFGPGTAMVHTNISSNCAQCHASADSWYGVTNLATVLKTTGGVTMSPLHVPITTSYNGDCSVCHSVTQFTNFTGGKVNHTSGTTDFMVYTSKGSSSPTCVSCHAPSGTKWYGISLSTETMGSHQSSKSTSDCINCHGTSNFAAAAAAAVMHRPLAHAMTGPAAARGGHFDHAGVLPGACASCHSAAGGATALPAGHLPTSLSCDSCHRTTSWLPALFAHNGVAAGGCASCHAGAWATAKPAGHMQTQRACDSCHHSTSAWTPVSYAHLDAIYTPHSAAVACVACHSSGTEQVTWKYPTLQPGCAGCHGPQYHSSTNHKMTGPGAVHKP